MADNLRDDPALNTVPVVEGRRRLGPCVLHDRIGAGGMGTVYRGRHLNLDIDVAVKCLDRSLAQRDQKFITRFQREARLAAAIDHENLIRVYDVGTEHDVHFIVMEFVRGETARERVARKGPLSEREALAILLGAASALGAAHARGVIHRDIKPDNIMISIDGRVKVADLGLAKPLIDTMALTQEIMGTPNYMAPEQWADPDMVGPWTDVWALGATLFFLVAGRDPFRGASAGQTFPNASDARSGLTRQFLDLLHKCVHADRRRRFVDAGALLQELRGRTVADISTQLVDPAGGGSTVPAHLVSPPPRVRGRPIDPRFSAGKDNPASADGGGQEAERSVPTSGFAATVPTQRSRRLRRGFWLLALAGLAVGTGVGASLLRNRSGTAPDIAAGAKALAEDDLRRAGGLVAESDVEAIRASLRADTRLSLEDGTIVGRRSKLEVSGAEGLVRCVVQGIVCELEGAMGTCELEFGADGPVVLDVQLEHETGVTETVVLNLTVDGTAPTLTCSEPTSGTVVRSPVDLAGTATDVAATEVCVGDRTVAVRGGLWALQLTLPEGAQTLEIEAVDAAGNRCAPYRLELVVDNTPPVLQLEPLPQETDTAVLEVVGRTESGTRVTIDGEAALVAADGGFRGRVELPADARREVTVLATDVAGNVTTRVHEITCRPRRPLVTLVQPASTETTWHDVVVLEGNVEPRVESLTIGGVDVPPDSAGRFRYAGQFAPGGLEVVAADATGSQTTTTVELRRSPELPLSVDPLPASDSTAVQVRGSTEGNARVRIGDRVVSAGADGRFELGVVLPGVGSHELVVHAWRASAPCHLGVALPKAFAAAARVEAVQPNTAAARVGIAVGDRIEAIDGRPTDAQGLLYAVARHSTAALTLRVRRGEQLREVTVTPWPASAATVEARAEVVDAGTARDGIERVFGIEPGVTLRAEVASRGTPEDIRISIFKVQGHSVYCDDRVATRVVLEGSPLPPNWLRLGFAWGGTEQECETLVRSNGWTIYRAVRAVPSRDGVLEFQVRQGLRVILTFVLGKGLTRADIKVVR